MDFIISQIFIWTILNLFDKISLQSTTFIGILFDFQFVIWINLCLLIREFFKK